jgi:hypothetical protein
MAMEMESCTPMDDSFVEMVANAALARGGKRVRDTFEPESLHDDTQATDAEAAGTEADAGDDLEPDDNDTEQLQHTFADDDEADAGDADMEDAEQLDAQAEEEQDDEDVDVDDTDDADAVAETSEPEAEDEEDGTSAPRMRLRDPSTIKRSQSSWMFFLADKREEVIYEHQALHMSI